MKKFVFILLAMLIIALTACETTPIDEPKVNPFSKNDFSVNDSVTDDFALILSKENIDITWSSNNPSIEVQNNTAIVTRGEDDVDVTLTASYTYQEEEYSFEFDVTVLALEEVDPDPNPNLLVLTFNITLPSPLLEGQQLSMGSNLNEWNPSDPDYIATKIDDYNYQLVLELTSVPSIVEYKWTIQQDSNANMWSEVEKGENGEEIGNRFLIASLGEEKTVNNTVPRWASSGHGSTANVQGNLEIIYNFDIPQISIHDTTIRIWTPSTYDPEDTTTRYPVIYMHDGQNLFDPSTSFAGEWGIDETIEDFIEESLHSGAIVVGIDNSGSYRQNTYTPEWDGVGEGFADDYLDYFPTNEVYGERYGRFIVETLKPYIDSNYNTLTDRENTSIAGSSMGGLISFYVGLTYMDVFGSIGIFSPAFQVATESGRHNFIAGLDFTGDNLPRIYIDGGELEGDFTRFVSIVASELYNAGLPEENIYTTIGENQGHNEPAWRDRFPTAFLWMFGSEDGNYIIE